MHKTCVMFAGNESRNVISISTKYISLLIIIFPLHKNITLKFWKGKKGRGRNWAWRVIEGFFVKWHLRISCKKQFASEAETNLKLECLLLNLIELPIQLVGEQHSRCKCLSFYKTLLQVSYTHILLEDLSLYRGNWLGFTPHSNGCSRVIIISTNICSLVVKW